MLGKFLRVSLMGMALGAVGGAFAPVQSVSAVRAACTCTMPALGNYSCVSPTSSWCNAGGWTCDVECVE